MRSGTFWRHAASLRLHKATRPGRSALESSATNYEKVERLFQTSNGIRAISATGTHESSRICSSSAWAATPRSATRRLSELFSSFPSSHEFRLFVIIAITCYLLQLLKLYLFHLISTDERSFTSGSKDNSIKLWQISIE